MLYIFKITGKTHFIITAVIFSYLCFIYDTGTYFDSHGGYNRVIFLLCLIGWLSAGLAMKILWLGLKKNAIITVIVIVFLYYSITSKIESVHASSCDGWDEGFKGTKIDNTLPGCKIYKPKFCSLAVFYGYLDFTKLMGYTCENLPGNLLSVNINHHENKKMKVLGFPGTTDWNHFPQSQINTIQKNVQSGYRNMETLTGKLKEKIEVVADFRENPPKLTIDLKKNETLIEERKKIFEKVKNDVLVKNVLYIFIDSLSRANFKRKLPKVHAWLESRYELSGDTNNKDHESFQFMKFHGLATYTGANMMPANFGIFNSGTGRDHYIRRFKESGFITGQSLEACTREVFDLDKGGIMRLRWDSFDHELISLFCDGNYTPWDSAYAILMGENSIRLRCLYNKSALSHVIEYTKQFWKKYENEAKFFRMGLYEAHEATNEVIKYSDDEFVEFLKEFESQGHLKDTILYFHNDHGVGMAGPYAALDPSDWRKELTLPSLYMVLPKNIKNYDTIRENLKHNEQAFFTHFSVHNSLHAIVNGWDRLKNQYASIDKNEILTEKLPMDRGCKFYEQMWNYKRSGFDCSCDEE